jgi:hypothetical protein
VQLSGTLLSPRIQLTSDTPVPLPESDLISYLLFGQPSFGGGGVNQALADAEQILLQEFVGGFLASRLEGRILRTGICDWVRVRPGTPTGFSELFPSALRNAAIECGFEVMSELFLTVQTGIPGLGGEFSEGLVGAEWQIDNQWLWEASYGSVPRNPLARIFDTGIRTQFSTDLRRQWEYGRPTQRLPIDLTPDDPVDVIPPPADPPTAPVLQPTASAPQQEGPPPSRE